MARPSDLDITDQLKATLETDVFLRAPQMARLLEYLVKEELAGRGRALKGYSVGVDALGKPVDFDPSKDASVRVEMRRLRNLLAEINAADVTIMIDVPKGSYRPRFSEKKPAHAVEPSRDGHELGLYIAAEASEEVTQRFMLRLQEELFRYREFRVIRGLYRDEPETTAGYNVRCRVEDRTDELCATVSVEDLESRRIVGLKEISMARGQGADAQLVSSLATEVAQALAMPAGLLPLATLQKRFSVPDQEWTTIDCILRWHLYRLRERTLADHARLKTQTERWIKTQPMFTAGYVILALLMIDEVVYHQFTGAPDQNALQRAEMLAQEAIALDRDWAMSHYVRAQALFFQGKLQEFQLAIDRAIQLHPTNPDLVHHAGAFLYLSGDVRRGEKLMDQAAMQDNPGIGYRLGYLMRSYVEGEFMSGLRLFESTVVPRQFTLGQLVGALLYFAVGDLQSARKHLDRALGTGSEATLRLTVALWFKDASMRARAEQALAEMVG